LPEERKALKLAGLERDMPASEFENGRIVFPKTTKVG
jgi:hypothetical protein